LKTFEVVVLVELVEMVKFVKPVKLVGFGLTCKAWRRGFELVKSVEFSDWWMKEL